MSRVHLRNTFVLVVWIASAILPLAGVLAQGDTPTVAAPPADYAEVKDTFVVMKEDAITRCRPIMDQLVVGDLEAFYEGMNDDLKAAFTLEDLETGWAEITSAVPVGEELDYWANGRDGAARYDSLRTWGTDFLVLTVVLDAENRIVGMNYVPQFALPDDPAADYVSEVEFRLPFDGLWYTFWGGPDELNNYHVTTPSQRHAYDFLIWKDGSTFSGDGTLLTDYYAYGQPVLAPAAGEVIFALDDLPDLLPIVESDPYNPTGNYVVIKVAEDAYLVIAHMQPDSLQVEVGDQIEAGQVIGLVGNSGNTSEPHIHIHLQNGPELFTYDESGAISGFSDVISLPLVFTNYLADSEPVEAGIPVRDQFIQTAP